MLPAPATYIFSPKNAKRHVSIELRCLDGAQSTASTHQDDGSIAMLCLEFHGPFTRHLSKVNPNCSFNTSDSESKNMFISRRKTRRSLSQKKISPWLFLKSKALLAPEPFWLSRSDRTNSRERQWRPKVRWGLRYSMVCSKSWTSPGPSAIQSYWALDFDMDLHLNIEKTSWKPTSLFLDLFDFLKINKLYIFIYLFSFFRCPPPTPKNWHKYINMIQSSE